MHRRAFIVVAMLASTALAMVPAPADAAKKPKPAACAGRFLVEGGPLFGGDGLADAVVVQDRSVTAGSCATVTGKVKAKKRFTLITARWKACAGHAGPATLTAKIDAASCRTLQGVFRAKKAGVRRRKVTASVPGAVGVTGGPLTPVALNGAVVGPAGGSVVVDDPASPLYGLRIDVPPGAASEPITFAISVGDVQGTTGLPPGAAPTSKLIRISASGSDEWNQFRFFDRPLRVTLPYTPPAAGEDTVGFYVLRADGGLVAAGQDGPKDTVNHRLSFFTRTFADTAPTRYGVTGAVARSLGASLTWAEYVAVGLGTVLSASLTGAATVETGFLPSRNGWFIPNYGSYYKKSRGGNCFGFVGAAQYYYRRGFGPTLYGNYRDPQPTDSWLDDKVAIEFTSRVHNGLIGIWSDFVNNELNLQTESSADVMRSMVGALYVTGQPVLLYIQQVVVAGGAKHYSGAHAISFVRATIAGGVVTFGVYDPNFPGKDGRTVTYTEGTGFTNYDSGTTAAESTFHYNFFKHVGFYVGMSEAELDAIKQAADRGFADGSVFPTLEVESIVGANTGEDATEGTTAQGEHKWITTDNAVTIRGKVTGGLAQDACCVVNNAWVFLSNNQYKTAVDNAAGDGTGAFAITVPVQQGENDFAIVGASASHPYTQWAGFFRDVIESTYSPAQLTITMSWGQPSSDVDLYVKEPDRDGKTGDTVYYAHRRGMSTTSPYLDLDNTSGYGPEHYIALAGMTTRYDDGTPGPDLYGDYTTKVHYYADHDDNYEEVQAISWSLGWRYLAYCPDPCADPEATGFWEEGGASGVLADASSGNCCNIEHAGADWSDAVTIGYPRPDPNDYVVPPSHAVMLP